MDEMEFTEVSFPYKRGVTHANETASISFYFTIKSLSHLTITPLNYTNYRRLTTQTKTSPTNFDKVHIIQTMN